MQHSHLSAELWQTVAKFCVQTHELGTVYNVTEDLSSLQCVCKSSSACAASLWSSVAELCHKQSKKLGMKAFDLDVVKGYLTKQGVMTKSLKLANAGNLAPEIHSVHTSTDGHRGLNQKQRRKDTVPPFRCRSTDLRRT